MTLNEAHLLSLDNEKGAPSTGFSLTVADLARLIDPVHPTHPKELGGIDEICQGLRVDPTVGLRREEENENSSIRTAFTKFAARKKAFGSNEPSSKKKTIPQLTLYIMAYYLTFYIMTLVTMHYIDPEDDSRTSGIKAGLLIGGILSAGLIVITGVTILGNRWTRRRSTKAIVLRDAREQEITVDQLQVGDILLLQPGKRVPVDGIVLQSHDHLTCNEPSGTTNREQLEIKPKDLNKHDYLISGTAVLSGSGSILVTAVGKNLLANRLLAAEDDTPKDAAVVQQAHRICIALGVAVTVVFFIRYLRMSTREGAPYPSFSETLAAYGKITAQIARIVLDAAAGSVSLSGLCLFCFVAVQLLYRRRSVGDVLTKDRKRMLVYSIAPVCWVVTESLIRMSMATLAQRVPIDATTLLDKDERSDYDYSPLSFCFLLLSLSSSK
ncbi:hypothetical protein MVEG_00476 [Podila verticillata NRRL 6337]|nr:hypothetical protein MVEG_00476 [Podila verticillata NRRL 6337]